MLSMPSMSDAEKSSKMSRSISNGKAMPSERYKKAVLWVAGFCFWITIVLPPALWISSVERRWFQRVESTLFFNTESLNAGLYDVVSLAEKPANTTMQSTQKSNFP